MLEKLLHPWEEFQSVQFWWNYLTYGWVIITTHFDLICLVYILKVKSKMPKVFQGDFLSSLFPTDAETFLLLFSGYFLVFVVIPLSVIAILGNLCTKGG